LPNLVAVVEEADSESIVRDGILYSSHVNLKSPLIFIIRRMMLWWASQWQLIGLIT